MLYTQIYYESTAQNIVFMLLHVSVTNSSIFREMQHLRGQAACYATCQPYMINCTHVVKVKFSRYWPGVAQRVGRGIALPFHDRGTRRGWVVSSMPWPHFTPRKDPVSIVQEAGWAPGPVWTGEKTRPHQDWIPGRPARSQSLYRLSYPGPRIHVSSFHN